MSASIYSTYSATVERILDETREKFRVEATRFRAEVLLPYCSRMRLEYVAGNGETMFLDSKGNRVTSVERPGLKRFEDVLNLPGVDGLDCFGYHVEDIRAKDWIAVSVPPRR